MSFQLQSRLLRKNLTIDDANGSILLAEAVSAVSPNLPIVSPSMGRDESRQRRSEAFVFERFNAFSQSLRSSRMTGLWVSRPA